MIILNIFYTVLQLYCNFQRLALSRFVKVLRTDTHTHTQTDYRMPYTYTYMHTSMRGRVLFVHSMLSGGQRNRKTKNTVVFHVLYHVPGPENKK